MYASLMAADLDEELHLLRDGKTRSTTGSVVSSLYHLKDIDNSDAGFFVFPDLSVRVEGNYRLKLSLFEIIGYVITRVFFCYYYYKVINLFCNKFVVKMYFIVDQLYLMFLLFIQLKSKMNFMNGFGDKYKRLLIIRMWIYSIGFLAWKNPLFCHEHLQIRG